MNIPYGPILVVEDTPSVRELLEVTLRFKGYPVVSAVNGQEALEIVARQRPAIIITDILMPKMDGYSLVHNLQKNPLTAQIPVIFVSATYVTPEDKAFALNLGAVRFIEKPIDTEDFLLTVAEILTQGAPQNYSGRWMTRPFCARTAAGWRLNCATRTPRSAAPSACWKVSRQSSARPLRPCCRRPLTTGMNCNARWKNCCKPSKISVSESNIAI